MRGRAWARLFALAVAVAGPAAGLGGAAQAQDSAVILTYQRFAETPAPLTTAMADLDAHIAVLRSGGYTVLPLTRIVAAFATGEPLPDRTVAITVEGVDDSIHRLAWPRFKAAGLPITVLVTTGAVDDGGPARMTWSQLRELSSAGVAIGTHGAIYRGQVGRPPAAVAADIDAATARMVAELGAPPSVFSYPYGLNDEAVRAVVAAAGFDAALGQQSGAAYRGSDPLALPRFSVFGRFAAPARFRVAADALPLVVADLVPVEPVAQSNPPSIGFTLDGSYGEARDLACFVGGLGRVALDRLAARRVQLSLTAPLPPGRVRVNCTLPGPEGRWRWLGLQILVPETG